MYFFCFLFGFLTQLVILLILRINEIADFADGAYICMLLLLLVIYINSIFSKKLELTIKAVLGQKTYSDCDVNIAELIRIDQIGLAHRLKRGVQTDWVFFGCLISALSTGLLGCSR